MTRADLEFGTIPALVRASAERFPDLEGLVDGELRMTFPELAARIEETARAFMAAGLQPGDRVGVWAPNIAEWVVAALGAISAGGVLVPLNTRFKGAEAAYVLERSGARFLCTVTGFLDTDYVAMLRDAGLPATLEHVVVLGGDAPEGTTAVLRLPRARRRGVDRRGARRAPTRCGPTTSSDILFTSGTTGKPEGRDDDATRRRCARSTPGPNIVGLARRRPLPRRQPVLPRLRLQGRDHRLLHPGRDHRARAGVRRARACWRTSPPSASRCSRAAHALPDDPQPPRPRPFDLSSLRLAVTGAAAVPVELIERMREELTLRDHRHRATGSPSRAAP